MDFLNFLSKHNKYQNNVCNYQQFHQKKQLAQKLKSNLTLMVDGDYKKADELIARARFADPGKSESYYCYKAIVNLRKSGQRLNSAKADCRVP